MSSEKYNELALSNAELVTVIATRAQQEMLLVEKTSPEINCITYSYRTIEGELDSESLAVAVDILINHLPLLQTRFCYRNDELWQIHDRRISHRLKVYDLRQFDDPAIEAEQRMQQSREQAKNNSIISEAPLYNFALYIVGEKKFVFNSWFHHVLIDGRSFSLFDKLLAKIYNNISQLDRIKNEFNHFAFDAIAMADQHYQNSPRKLKDKKFWLEYLNDLKSYSVTWRRLLPGTLNNKSTYLDTITDTQRGVIQRAALACGISEQIMLFSAAVLLIRFLIDKERFSVSIPVPGTGKMAGLGMTSNVLPLRVDLPSNLSLLEGVQSLSKEIKKVLKHQCYRGEDVQRLSGYRETAGFGPVINVMVFDRGEGFARTQSRSHLGANRDDLELQITFWGGSEDAIEIIFDDNTLGCSTAQLACLSQRLKSILQFLSHHPEQPVAELIAACQRDDDDAVLGDSFYWQRRQPSAGGFLAWQLSADALARQAYAGAALAPTLPAFAQPRVWLTDGVLWVEQLERRENRTAQAVAGTLLAIDQAGWLVAVASGAVYLRGLREQHGDVLTADLLAERRALQVGSQLALISAQQAEQLSACRRQLCQQQAFWQQCLSEPALAQLSSHRQASDQAENAQWQQTPDYRLCELLPDGSAVSSSELLAAWLIYLARDHHNRGACFQLGWQPQPHTAIAAGLTDPVLAALMLAPVWPFEIAIDLECSFEAVVAQVQQRCQHWQQLPACLLETVMQQQLAGEAWLAKPRPWPLAFAFAKPATTANALAQQAIGQLLTLHLDADLARYYWVYDASQITLAQVQHLSDQLRQLLIAAKLPNPAATAVARLNFLTAQDQQQLRCWSESEVELLTPVRAESATLPALFEAQLSHCADAIAVRYGEQALTYRALNQRANRLAEQLIKLGVQPEQRVALCAERSLELIVAIMAILKAGGAYLPLDPVHPTERLRYILQDAEPIVLLADQAGRAALGEPAIPTLMLDATQFEHGTEHNADVCPLTPSNLAYLIYTSGSTGQPKGVMVEHQQIVNLVLATGQLLVTHGVSVARMVMNASLMFDASWDELAVLFHGGTLILTASEQRYQP
ncbi:AMP-binding protein, partial [Serratia microhaemolytica]|uniref:AMP-binding protein n=1 Tax=Serratia microhaemolytica TaxID=2675110 RepID=UPI0012D77FD3